MAAMLAGVQVLRMHKWVTTNIELSRTVILDLPVPVALFHETERNLTKPSDYCRQMCYKNVSNSNISIPLSMLMRMDIIENV